MNLNRFIQFSKIITVGFIISSIACWAANPSLTPTERYKMKSINIGIIGPKKQLDPILGYNLFDFLVIQCIYQTLVRINADGNITSDLAHHWEISKDSKVYTFHLDPAAKFSDGSSVTTKDVAFSLSRHLWFNSKSVIKNYLSELLDGLSSLSKDEIHPAIKIISDTAIEIRLKSPYPPFLQVLAMPGFSISAANEKLRNQNIGSGHMKAHYDEKNNSWVLTPNPYYNGAKVNTKEIRIAALVDSKAAFDSIKVGSNDVILGLMSETGPGLTSMLPRDYRVYSINSLSFAHLVFNMKKKELQSIKLRKTLGLYLNQLAKVVNIPSSNFHHQTTVIPKGVLPLSYFNRVVPQVSELDLKKNLQSEFGTRLVKVILSEGRLPKDFVLKMTDLLHKVSPPIRIEELPVGEYRKRRDAGDYDIAYLGYIGNFADPDGFLDCLKADNFPGIDVDSNALFKSVEKIRFLPKSVDRLNGYIEALRKFEDQWTMIPLYQTNIPILHHKDITIPDTHYRYESELRSFLWKD